MQRYKILVDLDNTINDFSDTLDKALIKLNYTLNPDRKKTYKLSKYIISKSKSKSIKATDKVLNSKIFWKAIPVKDQAKNIVRRLCNVHDVYIVTTLWESYQGCARDKYNWIMKNLPFFDLNKVIFESKKWLVDGDVIIDDKIENLEKFRGISVCFDQPYNKTVQATHRVKNWSEIGEIFL